MAKNSEMVKAFLLKENKEFRRLAKKHRELDERIASLTGRYFLSDEEKFEEATLKKKKLALKDKMADFIRRHEIDRDGDRESVPTAPA
jgi:uncharacterized protein YdcH (DUF465 family)